MRGRLRGRLGGRLNLDFILSLHNFYFLVLEKLGTDDDELQNIADLIIKKAIRKKSQVGRLVLECSNLIEKKPLFRNIFLQNLQKSHQERKNVKKDNRENFIGLIMLLTEGKSQKATFTLDGCKYATIDIGIRFRSQ